MMKNKKEKKIFLFLLIYSKILIFIKKVPELVHQYEVSTLDCIVITKSSLLSNDCHQLFIFDDSSKY